MSEIDKRLEEENEDAVESESWGEVEMEEEDESEDDTTGNSEKVECNPDIGKVEIPKEGLQKLENLVEPKIEVNWEESEREMRKIMRRERQGKGQKRPPTTNPTRIRCMCRYCNATFKNKFEMWEHLKLYRNDGEEYMCREPGCQVKYKGKNKKVNDWCHGLVVHMMQHRGEERTFFCKDCGSGFFLERHLNTHIKEIHLNSGTFTCSQCGMVFHLERNLKIHLKKGHFSCPKCPKTFRSQEGVTGHMKVHDESKRYRCLLCPSNFESLHILKSHIFSHKDEKTDKCDHCDMTFKNKKSIRDHVKRVHLQEKNHVCQFCQKPFYSRSKMNLHVTRVHTNDGSGPSWNANAIVAGDLEECWPSQKRPDDNSGKGAGTEPVSVAAV